MQLSKKGIEKVENYSPTDLITEGFKPEDFKGVVVLTIKDAARLSNLLSYLSGAMAEEEDKLCEKFDRKLKRARRQE